MIFQHIEDFDLELANKIFEAIRNLDLEYPNFKEWYYTKVCSGLENKTRSILIVQDEQQKIVGVSILKNADEKKICTFRVASEFKYRGIGTELMRKSIEILGTDSPFITVSEDHIDEFKTILQKFNFQEFRRYFGYYRKGKYEIAYNGYLDRCIFSIQPEFAFKIMSGEKKFEYRKTRPRKSISLMVLYASSPIKKVVGDVQVTSVISGTPKEVWELTSAYSGICYDAYKQYFDGRIHAYAYQLEKPNPYDPYKDLTDFNVLRPPQSYRYL